MLGYTEPEFLAEVPLFETMQDLILLSGPTKSSFRGLVKLLSRVGFLLVSAGRRLGRLP